MARWMWGGMWESGVIVGLISAAIRRLLLLLVFGWRAELLRMERGWTSFASSIRLWHGQDISIAN